MFVGTCFDGTGVRKQGWKKRLCNVQLSNYLTLNTNSPWSEHMKTVDSILKEMWRKRESVCRKFQKPWIQINGFILNSMVFICSLQLQKCNKTNSLCQTPDLIFMNIIEMSVSEWDAVYFHRCFYCLEFQLLYRPLHVDFWISRTLKSWLESAIILSEAVVVQVLQYGSGSYRLICLKWKMSLSRGCLVVMYYVSKIAHMLKYLTMITAESRHCWVHS